MNLSQSSLRVGNGATACASVARSISAVTAIVAACRLGPVERGIGEARQALDVAGRAGGQAEAGRDRQSSREGVPRHGLDAREQLLGSSAGGQGVDLTQHEQELVSTQTHGDVSGPHPGAQDVGQPAKGFVADRVAVGVVDELEAIDVDEHERDQADVLGGEPLHVGGQRAPVAEPGEIVEVGMLTEQGMLGP